MSEEPPKYSDPEDQIDYQVIKSYGRASRSPLRNNLSYTVALVIIVLIYLITIMQAIKIRELETGRPELETKVTELETKMTTLETKVTELETKMTTLETKVTELETKKNLESQKNLENQKN